ncbi:MAG: ROK family protein [Candidatus Eisenbacteria bacterium]
MKRPLTGSARASSELGPRPAAWPETVLRMIWKERNISRADIARRTGLSRSTVTELVDALMPMQLFAERGVGPSRGGRPPIVLAFNDDAGVLLGVDMGAAHVSVALTNLRGQVLAWRHEYHAVRTDPDGTRALISRLCAEVLAERTGSKRLLVGIGVAVPCPVDPRHPERLSEVVMPDWKGRAGLKPLAQKYKVPLFMDNDANLGALAERWWGAGRGIEDFAYIKVATGIGSGHFVHGRIYRGATGVAGEIGHVAIDPQGRTCVCGLRGCLVTIVGSAALIERAQELRKRHPKSVLATGRISVERIEDAALAGDALANQVVGEAAGHLGVAVAGLLNLMNPQRVILGGGLSRLGDLLLEPLRDATRNRTLMSSLAAAQVVTSELGPQSIAVGAATMVLDAALTDSRLFPPPIPPPGVVHA